MWEVPGVHARNWARSDQQPQSPHAPRTLDVECPNPACRKALVNIQLSWKLVGGFLLTACTCAGCGQRTRFFLIDPPKELGSENLRASRLFQFPKPSVHGPFEQGISEISPSFVEIHSQAQEAEGLGLITLVGVGYRKALEFLIKDYLIGHLPQEKDVIARMPLAQCIAKYVADPRVKSTAERAVWLGNDETHYVRTWLDRDLQDLKNLITLTQFWIASEILTSKYGVDMTKPKPP